MQNEANNSVSEQGVWISREEYERLRQAQQSGGVSAPVYGSEITVDAEANTSTTWITVLLGLFALGLFAALTVPGLGMIVAPLGILFLVFAIVSLSRLKHNTTKSSTVYKVILFTLIGMVLTPVLAFGGLMVFVMVLFSLGGGQSS